ncbi:MAG: esterase [Bacteroidetes bacterium HGW-Bacteroidetes-2]|jgi:predicted esterase|nr:MAG: esterase [Bacteroidetes bacterium HGW-Bacteroidetes-2]
MSYKENEVSYEHINTFSTLNIVTEKTKNIWFVCHGLGYLSRYFIRYFNDLNPDENYIIAPQAPSKYYQGNDFKHVGASWLTKENTLLETENVLNFLDSVYKKEKLEKQPNLIVLGFSQGVSISLRWIAKRKIQCKVIIIHSGGIPKELLKEDFRFLNLKSKVYLVYGNDDKYIDAKRANYEETRAKDLFGNNLNILQFNGKHEINSKLLKELSDDNFK